MVSKAAEMEGKTVCIALQKIAGDWYAPGTTWPLNPADLSEQFWPAQVVYTL